MGIPESQLSKWSHHGPQDASKRTHKTIRKVLKQYPPLSEVKCDVRLQGSYSNKTNIQGDSDVDVVLELQSTFHYNTDSLSSREQAQLESSFPPSTYDWNEFRRDTLKALESGFGKKLVNQRNKSIKVKEDPPRLAADVVVCLTYRNYTSYFSYVEGITFRALQDKRQIINYPKLHYENGAAKSTRTWDRYKRTVRMFKSARNHLECEGRIGANLAPSYFVECLVYNAPEGAFKDGFRETYSAVIDWMLDVELDDMPCQNGQQRLFGPSPEQWNMEDAETFIDELGDLWDDWG